MTCLALAMLCIAGLATADETSAVVQLQKTGQTTSYAAGDDGDVQAGVEPPAGRFVDHGDGTVTDQFTGLMWTKDVRHLPSKMNWASAVTTAWNLSAFGYSDWRLPNYLELMSMVDVGDHSPALPSGHPFTGIAGLHIEDSFWSSTPGWRGPVSYDNSYALALMRGHSGQNFQGVSHYAWACRSAGTGTITLPKTGTTVSLVTGDDGDLQLGTAWPTPRFVEHGDGTVTDRLTGLMWTKNIQLAANLDWAGANGFVAGMNAGAGTSGYTDWRLPNTRELYSVADPSQIPALPAGHPFQGAPVDFHDSRAVWGSTTDPRMTHIVSGSSLHSFPSMGWLLGKTTVSPTIHVWAVRGGCLQNLAIVPPGPIVQACDEGVGYATVNFTFEVTGSVPSGSTLTVSDVTDSRTLLSQAAAAGTIGVGPVAFEVGASTVEIEIESSGGEQLAFASFTVQIDDETAPVLSGCGDKTIECTGPMTNISPASLAILATDACDPTPSVSLAPASLGLGTTEVTATATDATGNAVSCSFDVTVADTTAPVFVVCPDDVDRDCTGETTTVSFDVLAEDLCGSVTVTCEDGGGNAVDPSGTGFAIGTHEITCTASDSSGNEATCSFDITIVDNDDPVIVCPDDLTVGNDAGECFAQVSFSVTATDLCDPDIAIVCKDAAGNEIESGDVFFVGTTTITCTATDTSGNSASCSFNITVEDREAPVIGAPSAATLITDCVGSDLAVTHVSLGVSASDNCDLDPTLSISPAVLSPGTTAVTVTATDDDGNASSQAVSVTVLKGALTCRILRPLDANVDNKIRAGRTVPLKLDVLCQGSSLTDATVTIDEILLIDSAGTPIANEPVEDSGLSNDDGDEFRVTGERYHYNLSTASWDDTKGARHKVVIRIERDGHVDTLCEVFFVNK